MTDPTQSDADLTDQLFALIDAARKRAANVVHSAVSNPVSTGGDLLRGAAAGVLQMPFDAGALLAPAMGLIAPAAASTFGPLAQRTQALVDRSTLGTTSDAGALGNLLAQLAVPIPGAGSIGSGGKSLADLIRALR